MIFFWVISYFNSPICCTICSPHSCSAFYWTSAQAGSRTAWSPNNGLGVCTGKSSHFKFTYVLSHPILRPEWRQFLLAAHAKARHASGRAACSHSMNTFCCLLRRVLEEGVFARVGSPRCFVVRQTWPSAGQSTNRLRGRPDSGPEEVMASVCGARGWMTHQFTHWVLRWQRKSGDWRGQWRNHSTQHICRIKKCHSCQTSY